MSESSQRPPQPPTLRFILVCNGEVEQRGRGSQADAELSPTGRAQALAIGAELKQTQPDIGAVYSSPMTAAQTTAALLAGALRLPAPKILTGVGTAASEIAVLGSMQEHCWSALEALRAQHGPEGAVLLVSHDLPLRSLICRALSIPLEGIDRLRLDPASVSMIEFRGQRTLLAGLNDACHLR
jgi:broad specificity phosphatase PhoE